MAEKTTTKGRYYRFAPIYWYSWGLVNSALENEEKKKSKQSNNELVIETLPKKEKISLIEGKEYSGIIMTPKFGVEPTQIECKESPYPLQMRGAYDTSLYPDAEVWFVAGKEPNQKDKAKPYWFAYNIRMKEE
jgi:hypothetical protein